MTQPFMKLLLAGIAALGIAADVLTMSPSSHDFGPVPVPGLKTQTFVTTLPPGTAPGTTLTFSMLGTDLAAFGWKKDLVVDPFNPNSICRADSQGVTCELVVEFRPQSNGIQYATLLVTDGRGNQAGASLKGEGVTTPCRMAVVPCNYSHHYSGVVSWSGENGYANVDVVMGVASCNARTSDGVGMTSGPGLIGVEFDLESDATVFYRITVACPIRYPPEPARPAELGHDEFGSYKQPLLMTVQQFNVAGLPRLAGRNAEAGDIVSWNLCLNAQYRPAVRTGPAASQGPHDPCLP